MVPIGRAQRSALMAPARAADAVTCDCDRPIGKELSGQTRGCDANYLRHGSGGNWKDAESIARWLEPDDKVKQDVMFDAADRRQGSLSEPSGRS